MPEPFKNFFNPGQVNQMAAHLARADKAFDADRFIAHALRGFEDLELKQRSLQICDALDEALPKNFRQACASMCAALHPADSLPLSEQKMDRDGIAGWSIMPMADYVARRGMTDFETSMTTLEEMTKRFSAEFAIRPFYDAEPSRTLEYASRWARSSNTHVRRFASEGSRPRLPWGIRLQKFVEDPAPLLPLLTGLRDDESDYVRRSVANNLNDIAKDHPDLIAGIARDWLANASPDRAKLVRHACRSLVKTGHQKTLQALGYGTAEVALVSLDLSPGTVTIGQNQTITCAITSTAKSDQPLIVDYAVHHVKANGSTSPMVFKWKTIELKAGKTVKLKKSHSFKPVTTRTYYPGIHGIEVLINGRSIGRKEFQLQV